MPRPSFDRARLPLFGSCAALIALILAVGTARAFGGSVVADRLAATPPRDEITLAAPVEDKQAIVLLTGRRGADCARAETHRGWGLIAFEGLSEWSSSDPLCLSEVAVFSMGHAMYFERGPWKSTKDQLTPALQPRLEPPLNIVVVSNAANAAKVVDTDTAQASNLFDANRSGVAFGSAMSKVSSVPKSSALAAIIGNGCEYVYALRRSSTPVYLPNQINVYYVDAVEMGEFLSVRGYTCFAWGAPNVIYISLSDHSEVTLAHELGHAFGLRDPMGHVTKRRFGSKNIMLTGPDVKTPDQREHFTLGQAYRMNRDQGSWLNQSIGGRETTSCQNLINLQFPCPLLRLDPE
jgi:hypothetical protein